MRDSLYICIIDTSTVTISISGRVRNTRFQKIENRLKWIINFGFCVTHRASPSNRRNHNIHHYCYQCAELRGVQRGGAREPYQHSSREDGRAARWRGLGSARQCSARARPRSCTHVNCQLIVCVKRRFRPVRSNLLIIY